MNKTKLIRLAEDLQPISEEALLELDDKLDLIVLTMNETMGKREDLLILIGGQENLKMMKDNHDNHIRFIRSILVSPDPETLVDTVLWVFRAYMSRGFHTNYWSAQLNTWLHIMKDLLSQHTYGEIQPIYSWMILNVPYFTMSSEKDLGKSVHTSH